MARVPSPPRAGGFRAASLPLARHPTITPADDPRLSPPLRTAAYHPRSPPPLITPAHHPRSPPPLIIPAFHPRLCLAVASARVLSLPLVRVAPTNPASPRPIHPAPRAVVQREFAESMLQHPDVCETGSSHLALFSNARRLCKVASAVTEGSRHEDMMIIRVVRGHEGELRGCIVLERNPPTSGSASRRQEQARRGCVRCRAR